MTDRNPDAPDHEVAEVAMNQQRAFGVIPFPVSELPSPARSRRWCVAMQPLSQRTIIGLTNEHLDASIAAEKWQSRRPASSRGTSMENLALSGRSILVVEDEPLIALDLRNTFESAGAYVFASTQHPHALQLAGHPDLSAAVLDYRLGQEDTTAICARLEQCGVPFVFYCGYDDVREQCPHAVRVPKPASPLELSKPSRWRSNLLSIKRDRGPRVFAGAIVITTLGGDEPCFCPDNTHGLSQCSLRALWYSSSI
jgi:CheY-like chemotaxis protein